MTETVYNWEEDKNRKKLFFDDGSLSYFWKTHTVLVLVIFSTILLCEVVFDTNVYSTEYNINRGVLAIIFAFILFGVIHMPDGPYCRPHPAFWRMILCLSIVYEMGLIFLLFQNVSDARQFLRYFDTSLGVPLEEKEYGSSCVIYDRNNTQDPFHNFKDKMDGFVVVHFIGWFLKTLILRDYWICNVLSLMFEFLEYTLEHQLPNFSECWWDHWIMDFLVCNLSGIYLGMKTLNYLSLKPYHWSSMWHIRGYKGKLKRLMLQFTPRRWTDFDWRPFDSLKRWIGVLILIGVFLLAELNTFYLKYVLWIPPPHFLCLGRLVFLLFMGAVAIRQYFQFLDDPHYMKLGDQAWMICAIIITELLICLKFDWETVSKPLPYWIGCCWLIGSLILFGWTFWHFFVKRWLIQLHRYKLSNRNSYKSTNGISAKSTNRNPYKSTNGISAKSTNQNSSELKDYEQLEEHDDAHDTNNSNKPIKSITNDFDIQSPTSNGVIVKRK